MKLVERVRQTLVLAMVTTLILLPANAKAASEQRIRNIQGTSNISPDNGDEVGGIPGIVTVVLGEINDFQFSKTLDILAGNQLQNLADFLPKNDRYSYLFEGNFQMLDHILVSQHPLIEGEAELDIVHLNAGFPNSASDHDPLIMEFKLAAAEKMTILPGETGASLRRKLAQQYKPTRNLGYRQARDVLYSSVENNNGVVTGVYTGYQITLNPNAQPRSDSFEKGINTEHVYPQSKGAQGSAKGDLHNLFPTRIRANSIRGNSPFAEIPDSQTTKWLRNQEELRNVPRQAIDDYSESTSSKFEPREEVKGNIARAMFYFYTIYQSQADAADSNFFTQQQATLCQWHQQDPIETKEIERSQAIANSSQGNNNPFVLDPTLAKRAYCGN